MSREGGVSGGGEFSRRGQLCVSTRKYTYVGRAPIWSRVCIMYGRVQILGQMHGHVIKIV
jgi:hypothetical protein